MLGLDSTEGVQLLFHDLHQQSSGNSCAAFAVLYSVALAFFVLPHDLRVSEVQEIALRRRLHDFYFCTDLDGTPSLTPLRRALEAATNLFHDDEDAVQVPCHMCPDGQARALDLSIASADCSITQLSLSDHEDPDPPPLATSSPPPPKRKAPPPSQSKTQPQSARKKKVKRTERVRKRKVELGSAFLPPLKRRGVAPEEESLCPFCESFLLAGEAGSESEVKSKWCCSEGALVAPKLQAFEADFYQEGRYILPAFRDAARKLSGMAAMASSGVAGKWVTFGGGTSYVKVQGRTYHKLHNLGDPGTRRPNQMCILSPDFQKLHSRSLNVNPELTARVFEFLHRTNPLYATYRRLDGMASTSASLLFQKTTRKTHGHVLGDAPGRQHNLMPQAEEITAVISTDAEAAPRDVRVWAKGDVAPKTLSPLDPAYEALSYPLLRPAADASWDLQMVGPPQKDGKRRKITQLQYQRQMHLSQPRMWEVGRLGQEALVDAFCRIESARLNWVRSNQATLRMGTREEVARQMGEEADPSILAGRQIILPASFTNSPRQMRQLYHDAMCVVAAKGKPTFFITVTCNPKWAEIAGAEEEEVEEAAAEAGRLEGLPASRKRKTPAPKGPSAKVSRRPTNCPSITARVFKQKLALLMHDVRSGRVFGSQTVYSMECIEFQKRGLPHAHIIVRLVDDVPMDQIDDHISARLPGPDQPDLRAKVLSHMIHGPCGVGVNPGSPCMIDGRCSKRYPMGMEETTRLDERGFPHYRRTAEHSAVIRRAGRDLAVNDSFVVPHSPALLQKYDCHINVEYASTPRTVKYLFKYVLKGPDRAKAVLSEAGREVDEVQDYESQRMIGACEAAALRKLVISGETEQEAKAKAREEAVKLEKRAEEVVAMAFGMKEEILRRFVETYKKTVKFAHKLKSQVGQADKKGVAQTLESLLRPKQAQVHRKTQRPFGWVPPVDAKEVETVVKGLVDLVAGAEDVVEGLVNLVVEEMSQEGGPEWEDPGAVSIVDFICEEIAEAEERLEEEKEEAQTEDDSLGVWGEGGNEVCGSHCVLPPRCAERIAEPLMALRPYRVTNVWECVRDFMQLQACKGCFVELTLPCVQEEVEGKECTDLVKVCLQVRPHSKEVDSLLRHMVYEGSHLLKRLMNLVDVMKRGDLDTLAGLIRVRVDPEAEAQGGVSTSKIGPIMREDEIMEKFGRMAKRFREAEEDHPVHPCFWCEQRYTRKRLAVEGMKSVDDKSVKGMSGEYHRPNLKASLERRLALTGQKEAEAFPMNICTYCMADVTKGTIGRRMVENGFRTDPVPEELGCLNPYEEKFVSLVLPCYEVITLRPMGGKLPSRLCMKGTRGNIVHLRVPIEETVEHVLKTADQPMPVACDPAKSLRIYADVTTKKGKRWRNLVDMEKVIRALEWLVMNNPIYAKVRLDKEALRNYDMDEVVRLVDLDNPAAVDENLEDEAPEDEEEADERERYPAFLTQQTEEHRLVNEFSMAPINRPKIAVGKDVEELRKTLTPKASGKDDPKVYRDKKIESELMAWHKAPNLDLMSLPMLYPLGRDGTFTVRSTKVRPAEYQKYRLMNKDGRFRRKKMFIHFSSFHKRERAVDSGVFASTHRNSASAKLTAGQVTAKLEGKDKDVEALTKELSTAMKAQKGSAEYWKARTGDLAVMDEELGPAHLFLTFSSTTWGPTR